MVLKHINNPDIYEHQNENTRIAYGICHKRLLKLCSNKNINFKSPNHGSYFLGSEIILPVMYEGCVKNKVPTFLSGIRHFLFKLKNTS